MGGDFSDKQRLFFERGVVVGDPQACWPWQHNTDGQGYGRLSWEGKDSQAHRISHNLATGDWPEAVLHSCDNPPCCNPAHLSSGTRRDNNHDKIKKGRHLRGAAAALDKPKKVYPKPGAGTPRLNSSKAHLSAKQAAFVREYLKDYNGKQAAIRAGYAPRSADVMASDLLVVPKVKAEIDRITQKALAKTEITVSALADKLMSIAFAPEPTEDTHFSQIIYPKDRIKAIELLGRYKSMFVDRKEISGPEGSPIAVAQMTWLDVIGHEDNKNEITVNSSHSETT